MGDKDSPDELKGKIRDLERELHELRQKLEELYIPIIESSGEGIFVVDRECRYLMLPHHMASHLDIPVHAIVGKKYGDFHGPEATRIFEAMVARVFESGLPLQDEYTTTSRNKDVLRYFYPLKTQGSEGEVVKVAVVSQDISARREMERELRASGERYRTIIENISEGYYEVDLDGNYGFLNEAGFNILGRSHPEIIGFNYRNFTDEEDGIKLQDIFRKVHASGSPSPGCEWRVIRKDGKRRHVESSISPIRDGKGEIVGFRGIIRDVTEKKKDEETIHYMAYHDFLTGLPNRFLLSDRLNVALAQARRHEEKFALMTLDLDKFKDINDTRGHEVGDVLLRCVGKRLAELIRESDTAARVGGDEFTLLLRNITDNKDAAFIAVKILEAFRSPFPCEGRLLHVTPSIGIAVYPDHGLDMSSILNHADQAMYRAKEKGNSYWIYGN